MRLAALVPGVGTLLLAGGVRAQLLITGNDEKVSFDENTGKTITHPAGKDTVSIIDISDPAKPKIVVNLPLMNTITGPPVNLAITPIGIWRWSPIRSIGSAGTSRLDAREYPVSRHGLATTRASRSCGNVKERHSAVCRTPATQG